MSAVDLSSLPAPQIIDVPDFETLLTARKARLVSLYPAELQDAVARALELESEPQLKILQENCYREILLRQRINEAVQAVIIARSGGGDLDNLSPTLMCSVWSSRQRMKPPFRRFRRSWKVTRIYASARRKRSRVYPWRGLKRRITFTPAALTGGSPMHPRSARHPLRWW